MNQRMTSMLMFSEISKMLSLNLQVELKLKKTNTSGSAIIVSHDRWFLDRLCTHIIAFEQGNVIFFEGNYSEYEKDRKARLGKMVSLLIITFCFRRKKVKVY